MLESSLNFILTILVVFVFGYAALVLLTKRGG